VIFKNGSRNLLAAACLSAGVAIAPAALAQAPAQPSQPSAPAAGQPSQPATPAPAAVSEEKLQSFAVALAEVEKIKQEYSQRLQSAGSQEEQQQIQNEAGQKMLQAVEAKGISVDEYNQIVQSAQSDPAVAERLNKAMGQTKQ